MDSFTTSWNIDLQTDGAQFLKLESCLSLMTLRLFDWSVVDKALSAKKYCTYSWHGLGAVCASWIQKSLKEMEGFAKNSISIL